MGAAPGYLIKLLEGTHQPMGLALAALALGKESDSRVDMAGCMDRIVALANEICERLPPKPATGDVLFALNTHLFDELGFTHCMTDSPGRGPFIHSLLEERQGEAIGFVILYLTLGRLLHLPLEGVAFSGRLLLRVADGADEDVIDPCSGGVVLTCAELKRLFEDAVGGAVEAEPRYRVYLKPLDDRAIMVRLLRRYKAFHLSNSHYARALSAIEAIMHIAPGEPGELLEYGQLLETMAYPEAAAAAYFHYIERHPGSPELPRLRQRLRWLLGKRTALH